MENYNRLYLQGIEYFNDCEYFEAHEVWEDLWNETNGPLRKFYQGLIQVAVALHHFGNGNVHGARKLYGTSSRYLDPYRPHCEGLDLEKFLAQFEACFAEVVRCEEKFPKLAIDPELIPEIHLEPAANEPTID